MDIGIVHSASPADRAPLQHMLELYQYELSDIWDQDLDEQGEYGYALDKFFDPALRGHTHHAFIVRAEGQFAGFALVNDALKVGAVGQGHWMDQFFILKKYRRQGLGRLAATQVFAARPGHWEVGQMLANHAAQAFWRRVIAELPQASPMEYREHRLTGGWWEGIVQCFDNAV